MRRLTEDVKENIAVGTEAVFPIQRASSLRRPGRSSGWRPHPSWRPMLLGQTSRTVGAAAQGSQARGRLAPSSNIMKGSGLGQCRGFDAAQGWYAAVPRLVRSHASRQRAGQTAERSDVQAGVWATMKEEPA